MSEILDLAKRFEAKSKQQARNIEGELASEFERHGRFIAEALRSSEQKISEDIHGQHQRLTSIALQSWLWLVVSIVLIVTVSWGALWWTGSMIEANLAEISRQERTLAKLSQRGGMLETAVCGKQDRLCVKVVPGNGYGKNSEWMILEGY